MYESVVKLKKKTKKNNVDEKIALCFLFVYYVLPQYFGIRVGFDFTAQRMMVVLFMLYIFENKQRSKQYISCVTKSTGKFWLLAYMVVLGYTAILRVHVGTILYSLFEFVAMFIVAYIAKEILGIKRTVDVLNALGLLLCILGVVEFFMRKTPFSYLETLDGLYTGAYIRAGNYRIMGPANHSLGYGLMLVIMLPLACLDLEKNEVSFFRRFPYFALIIINVLLTGSRSTMAVLCVELLALFLFHSKSEKKKTIIFAIFIFAVISILVVVSWGSKFSRYIMLQVTSVLDEIMGTSNAVKYGADINQLRNSSEYRKQLPEIFKIGLNPILGRGAQPSFAWTINGWFIHSVDNFYVATFIRYAYPGLFTYMGYILSNIYSMLRYGIKNKSAYYGVLAIGTLMYFLNLWWLDGLMTYKYVYILIALAIANWQTMEIKTVRKA